MAVSNTIPQAGHGAGATPETLLQVFWRRYRRNSMAVVGLALGARVYRDRDLCAAVRPPYHYNE